MYNFYPCSQRVHIISADVSEATAVKEKILTSVASSGHVDVLINCAGITHTATMQETPSEKYQVGMYILTLVSFEGWRFF